MRAAIRTAVALALCLATVRSAIGESPAVPDRALDALVLPAGSEHVVALLHYRWFGLPLAARSFDAPGPLAVVMAQLRSAQPAFRDVRAQSNEVVLSGTQDGQQWIARLTPLGQGRVDILISTLSLPAIGPMARPPANANWLPRDAHLRFDLAADDGHSLQQIWTHGLAPAALAPMLHKALRVRGWVAASGFADANTEVPSAWSRGSTRLDLSLLPAEGGSAIVIRRHTHASERS
jgi:hypothetical protein